MNVAAAAGRVEVKRQHPPGAGARVIYRHRARLARRVGRERPGMAGRVGPAAVTRNPDMRSTGNAGRYRTPSRRGVTRRPGERERARTRRNASGSCGVSYGGNSKLTVRPVMLVNGCGPSVRDLRQGWRPLAGLGRADVRLSWMPHLQGGASASLGPIELQMLKADWSAQHPRRPGAGSTASAPAQPADSPDRPGHAVAHSGHTGRYHSSTEHPGHWGLMTGPEHCHAPAAVDDSARTRPAAASRSWRSW